MATFSLAATAGHGFQMSTLAGASFGFAGDDPTVAYQRYSDVISEGLDDNSPWGESHWNVHGGAADTLTVTYGAGPVDGQIIQKVEFGGLDLTASNLAVAVTSAEYATGGW